MEQPTREQALGTPLRELHGCQLRVMCPTTARCSKVSLLTITNLARRLGAQATLLNVIARLKCQHCGSRAGHVELCGPKAVGTDPLTPPAPAWSVVLREGS